MLKFGSAKHRFYQAGLWHKGAAGSYKVPIVLSWQIAIYFKYSVLYRILKGTPVNRHLFIAIVMAI